MLRSKITFALATCVVVSMAGTLLGETKTDVKAKMTPSESKVRAVVAQHIDGIVQADVKKLEQSWDTKAGQITFVSQNKDGSQLVKTAPITESFELWTAKRVHGTKGSIQSVDVVNDKMAMVKAQMTWKGQVFDDYLVLLNTENGWRLVSKTYTSKRAAFQYGASSPY